jgi:4,5-DOPA dioxygenase extradiol
MHPPLPSLFVSHGAPDISTSAPQAVEAMQRLAGELSRPESILIVSAH